MVLLSTTHCTYIGTKNMPALNLHELALKFRSVLQKCESAAGAPVAKSPSHTIDWEALFILQSPQSFVWERTAPVLQSRSLPRDVVMPSRKEKKVKKRERELYDKMMSSESTGLKLAVPRDTPNCARVGLDDDNRTYAAGPNGERQPLDTLKSMKDANPDPNPIDRAAYRDITHARLADKMGTDRIVTDPLWGSKDTGIGPMNPAERKRHMERQDRIKHSMESPYSTANMKTPAIPEGLKGEEQMSAWIAQNRVELVANLMEGEIGEALAQSSAPKQSDAKVIDSKGRARNRLKLSEFMEEQEQQQMQLGTGFPPASALRWCVACHGSALILLFGLCWSSRAAEDSGGTRGWPAHLRVRTEAPDLRQQALLVRCCHLRAPRVRSENCVGGRSQVP